MGRFLPPAYGVEVIDALATTDSREHHVLFGQPIGREEHRDRLTHRFIGGVAEQPLGAAVPRRDDAVEIFADDRVL